MIDRPEVCTKCKSSLRWYVRKRECGPPVYLLHCERGSPQFKYSCLLLTHSRSHTAIRCTPSSTPLARSGQYTSSSPSPVDAPPSSPYWPNPPSSFRPLVTHCCRPMQIPTSAHHWYPHCVRALVLTAPVTYCMLLGLGYRDTYHWQNG
ncbi:hypothetical protein LY76DRAFT_372316 [Colletotrichum caudatum]|nr:hypothetical protein LY76DRAFT_372316 [Colletotrichum caudatum]